MNGKFNFPTTDYDLAGDAEDLDPSDIEIMDVMEGVFGLSGPDAVTRLLRFADDARANKNMTEH